MAGHGSFFEQLLPVLFPTHPAEKRLVVLRGYLDESGLPDLGVYSVAACIWDGPSAEKFDADWLEALHELDDIPYFHMAEYESRECVFSRGRWATDNHFRNAGIARLIAITNSTIMYGISASIDTRAFDNFSDEQKAILHNPHSACTRATLGLVASVLDADGKADKVAYVFGERPQEKAGSKTSSIMFFRCQN